MFSLFRSSSSSAVARSVSPSQADGLATPAPRLDSLPPVLRCALSGRPLDRAVRARNGIAYDHAALESHLETHGRLPNPFGVAQPELGIPADGELWPAERGPAYYPDFQTRDQVAALSRDDSTLSLFLDPVTGAPMATPVVASDGRTYDRDTVARILRGDGVSPFTGEPLAADVIQNRTVLAEMYPEAATQVPATTHTATNTVDPSAHAIRDALKVDLRATDLAWEEATRRLDEIDRAAMDEATFTDQQLMQLAAERDQVAMSRYALEQRAASTQRAIVVPASNPVLYREMRTRTDNLARDRAERAAHGLRAAHDYQRYPLAEVTSGDAVLMAMGRGAALGATNFGRVGGLIGNAIGGAVGAIPWAIAKGLGKQDAADAIKRATFGFAGENLAGAFGLVGGLLGALVGTLVGGPVNLFRRRAHRAELPAVQAGRPEIGQLEAANPYRPVELPAPLLGEPLRFVRPPAYQPILEPIVEAPDLGRFAIATPSRSLSWLDTATPSRSFSDLRFERSASIRSPEGPSTAPALARHPVPAGRPSFFRRMANKLSRAFSKSSTQSPSRTWDSSVSAGTDTDPRFVIDA